ncbi:MAG: hypothetical protein WCL57_14005 [Chloroflexota bacterium]|nr:hypothetical protein [Chloroflexota bacterium]
MSYSHMLEKPNLSDEEIKVCLKRDYGLRVAHVNFLPLGVYVNVAFDEVMSTLPKFLVDQVWVVVGRSWRV